MKFLAALRAHKAVRYLALAATIAIVLLSAAIVTTLTIDLGPALRGLAERQGSERLKRPIHIGALKLRLLRGRVELDDFSIEGLAPTDRPFFSAGRLSVSLDWSKAVARRPEFIITSVEMTDWRMLVERFADADNFPRFRNDRRSIERAKPLHHHDEVPARVARPFRLRGS